MTYNYLEHQGQPQVEIGLAWFSILPQESPVLKSAYGCFGWRMRNERKLLKVPGLLVLVALIAVAIPGLSQTSHARPADQEATAPSGKIAPWVMERLASGGQAEFLIVLADQADLSGAEALPTKLEKGRYVRDALWSKAQSTQAPLLAQLAARHIEHRSYYIVNLIWAKGDRNLALDLAARPDVARIEANPQISNFKAPFSLSSPLSALYSPNGIEPNIAYVHAPDVWALGFTGQGIVVGGQDTGTTGATRRSSRTIAVGMA